MRGCRMTAIGAAYPCRGANQHDFDWYSGWCRRHGCGVREDGRVISVKSGAVLHPGPTYTEAELDKFRHRNERKNRNAP